MNDNAKGYAKSAGALLRRYGEQALRDVGLFPCPMAAFDESSFRTSVILLPSGRTKSTPASASGYALVVLIGGYLWIMKRLSLPRVS